MDRNVDELDDIQVVVEDTNVKMELENKLVSDLMKSLEYENQQGTNEEIVQDGQKMEAKSVPVYEPDKTTLCEASKSCERDLSGLDSRVIPLIVIETEDEWKKRESYEKTPGKRDEISLPGETTMQEKQDADEEEDFEFEINMEQFQKQLSDVVKDDANTRTRSKDIFSSILEELESHIEKEAFGSLSEEETDQNEEGFESVLRASEEGQCCGATSELEITCDISQGYLPGMLDNMSVNVMESCLDPQPVPTITEDSLLDSAILIESTKKSDLEGASHQPTPETPSDSAPRNLEHFTQTESTTTQEDLVNYTKYFDENDPQGQNDESSFISGDIFDLKNADDVIACETQEGGPKDEFPLPLVGDSAKTYTKNIQPKALQEEVMDNVDVFTGSLNGILSRNDVDDEESVDLEADISGGSLQGRFMVPINSSSGGDDRAENDLLEHQKILAVGKDDYESEMTVSRKGELYVVENIDKTTFAASEMITENETLEAVARNETEWEDRMEDNVEVVTEEKNLISFDDDDDVLVTTRDLVLATALTMSNREEHGQKMGHCIDLLAEDREGTHFVSESNILVVEDKSHGESGGLHKMENVNRENERELPSLPVIGTLVEISPHCTKPSHEAAGISLRSFENIGVIVNSCKDQILSETPTCTDIHLSEHGTTTISSNDVDIEDQKQAQDTPENSMDERREQAGNSCDYAGFTPDSGKDSEAQCHDLQTMDEICCIQKNEEFSEKKTESTVYGSTKRQREQDADVEGGLKRLKINDSFEENHLTNDLQGTRDIRGSEISKNKEKTPGTESIKCENNVRAMEEEESCLNSAENIAASSETRIMENDLLTSHEFDSHDEQEEGNVLLNSEENYKHECVVRTSNSTSGAETLVAPAEHEIALETLVQMNLNNTLIADDSKNREIVEVGNSIPCCYSDAVNKSNEKLKLLLENERAENGNGDKVERDTMSFQDVTKQLQLLPDENCSPTKSTEQASASGEDSVSVLSENLKEIFIGEEEKQTSSEEPLVEISTDSNGGVGVTLYGVTRVTQAGTGVNAHFRSECQKEFEGSVTQEVEQSRRDFTVKEMQSAEQEKQIHTEGQATEGEKGDVAHEEESVAQRAEKKEQKHTVSLEPIQECAENLEELETEEILLTQQVTLIPAETSSQVVTLVEQSVTQDDTRDTKKGIAEAKEHGKGIGEGTLEGKQVEVEGQVAQPEEVTQQVAEDTTPDHKDDTKELKINEKVTQEEKPVTQLQEEKVAHWVHGTNDDVSAVTQLLQEVMQPEVEGDVTQENEENAKEKYEIEDGQRERKREQLEEETLEVKRESERKEEEVSRSSTDKQQELKVQGSGINFDSQGNQIKLTESKTKIAMREEEEHGVDDKSSETGNKENEMASAQESEKDEDKENRIRSFEMLVHLETIIKEIDMYRREQKKLRDSFKICMNEIMINLSSMAKAVQLMETRLNQKIKDAHDELKKCCGNLENNRDTILSMDALLRSYSVTQHQFGDLRQRVKDLEIICTALNISEMQDQITNQVSAEIDAMDRRVRVTENDVSDLQLRVTELEAECSSLRKLTPVDEQLEIQAGRREMKFSRASAQGRTRENLNEELLRSSPEIGPGQRYYGLYSEEV